MKRKRRERTLGGSELEDGDEDLEKEVSKWMSRLDGKLWLMERDLKQYVDASKRNSVEMEKSLTNLICKVIMSRRAGCGGANANVDAGLEDESGLWGFVNPCDLFKLMLQTYLEKEGLSPDKQKLILAGKELEDGRILKVSCASRESTLHLAVSLKHRKVFPITVMTLTGKTIVIRMTPTATIYDLKKKIQDKEGIPPIDQRYVYAGRQLDDDKTIEDYGIVSGSLLHLIIHFRG